VLGANLRAVAIYGSAASGDRTRKYSDVNLLVIVDRADSAALEAMGPMFAGWIKHGNRAPMVVVASQIRRSQDVFPIELSDIRDRHRLLHGDPALLTTIEVQPSHLRRQLEFELRSKLFLLRQAFIESAGRGGAIEEVMARSLSSVAAVFRGVLRLLGEKVPASTPEVLRALQQRVPIDADAWSSVWRLRQGERLARQLDRTQLFDRILTGLQNAVNFVDAYTAS